MSPKKPNLPSRKVDNVASIVHPFSLIYHLKVRSSSDNEQLRSFFRDRNIRQMGLNMLKIRGEWYTIQNKKQQRIEFSNWDRGHPTGKPDELGDLT